MNVRLPFPEFVTFSDAGLGFVLLPWVPLKDTAVGEMESCGVGAATLNVTVTVAGEFCAPEAVTVTWPVYEPAASDPIIAET